MAGDITPPPALATMQAAQTLPPETDVTETTGVTLGPTTAPAEPGMIRGRVTNGTPGGPVPAGIEVTLSGYEAGSEVFQRAATTAEDGTFVFAEVPAVPDRIYGVRAAYQEVLYYSEGARLVEGQPGPELPVIAYETTPDRLALHIERLHVLFDFSTDGRVQVIELWVLSNRGDRTIVAAPGEGVVEVSLPQGAADLAFEDDSPAERYLLTTDGFADREPVLPGTGTSQFVFRYWLEYDGRLAFSRGVNYPVNAVVILVPGGGIQVRGEGLRDLGVQTMSGQPVQTYERGAISPGAALDIELSGLPGAGATTDSVGMTNLLIGLGLLVLLLAGAGVWWFEDGRAARRGKERRAEALLNTIAALDDALEAGRIGAAEHHRRREALKSELIERMRRGHD